MPTGVIMNVLSVVLGGFLRSIFGNRLSEDAKRDMTALFGVCALAMGIVSVVLMRNMPAVVFSVIVGTMTGTLLNLDGRIRRGTEKLLSLVQLSDSLDQSLMITALVLFCASGTGIYGSLTAGMTGGHSILLAKAVLDFFTAMIFACTLKRAVMLIGIPQAVVILALFYSSRLILPLTT